MTRRCFALALSEAGEPWSAPEVAVAMTARMPHGRLQSDAKGHLPLGSSRITGNCRNAALVSYCSKSGQ
jgi:hypothetical protein